SAGDVRVVARDGCELVTVAHDEPDGAVLVAVLTSPALEPFVERVRMPLPVLRERLVQRAVEGLVLVVAQLVDDELTRERGPRRLLGQLDRHFVEASHLAVAARLEELARSGVGLRRAREDPLRALRAGERLAALEDLCPKPASLVGDDAPGVRRITVHAVCRTRDDAVVLRPDPLLLAPLPEQEDVRAGETTGTTVAPLLLRGDERRDGRRVVLDERTDVHASSLSQTTCSESTTIPTLSYSFVAP